MKTISVHQLKEMRDQNDDFQLLDVREDHERFMSDLGGIPLPLAQLESRLSELDPEKPLVVMCRSGSSSLDACKLLEKNGFKEVIQLDGGINAWAREIDPTMPVY
jgi:rhodanese-related sulfurtransferase